jgi:tetratricopeptide (TPR) repeat protein
LGDYRKALADYTESIRYEERQQTVRGTGITRGGAQYVLRAELYAACPDPQIRNAQQSIADAEPQCARSTPYNGQALAALAAAYAESGDFFAAVECQEKAIVAVEKERNDFKQDWVQKETSKRLEEYRSRLALYQSHQPYRLPAVVKGASAAGK